MITREDALKLYVGQSLFFLNKEGNKVLRCRVSGTVKTWKTRPNDFYFPVKYGLYENAYIGLAGGCPERDFVNGKDLMNPERFFINESDLDIFLAPVIKGKVGTKKQIKDLEKCLTL